MESLLSAHTVTLDDSVDCTEGEIRLVSGLQASSGRVEICHNNEWGTVCNDNWGIHDAEVVCRQHGFRHTLAVGGVQVFGRGFDKVWLDDVNCTGSESRLANCMHRGWGVENCHHYEDAGVFCSSECMVYSVFIGHSWVQCSTDRLTVEWILLQLSSFMYI